MVASLPYEWFGDQRDTDIAPGLLQFFVWGVCVQWSPFKNPLGLLHIGGGNFNRYLSREEGLTRLPRFPYYEQWYSHGLGTGHHTNYNRIDSTFLPELLSSTFD